MDLTTLAVGVLVAFGVAVELACCIGIVVMRDVYDKLHFTGPATILGPLALAGAIVVQEGLNQAGIKAVLIAAPAARRQPRADPRHRAGPLHPPARPPRAGRGRAPVNVLLGTALVLVAAAGTVVVVLRDPLRQALAVSMFGILLGIVFFAVQAPDVALSEIVVGAVALPLMILLALAKIRGGAQ